MLSWLKRLILPAAKAHTSRKIAAVATVASAISGFRFVDPVDDASRIFRVVCLVFGTAGFVFLAFLFIFPPSGTQPTRARRG
jgi:hypothetical protein